MTSTVTNTDLIKSVYGKAVTVKPQGDKFNNLESALVSSLNSSGLLSASQSTADFIVQVAISKEVRPGFGGAKSGSLETLYTVRNANPLDKQKEVLFSESVNSNDEGGAFEAFSGEERARLVIERYIKKNIEIFLTRFADKANEVLYVKNEKKNIPINSDDKITQDKLPQKELVNSIAVAGNAESQIVQDTKLTTQKIQVEIGKDKSLPQNALQSQAVERRVALVIGNSNYVSSALKNPANDAKDISDKLKKLNFEVIIRVNLTSKQIGSTLREFKSKLTPGSVALVFYAGHGLQIKGENYLPTVDAEIFTEEDVQNQSLSTKQIMNVLDDSKTRLNLVFLDACRDNPFARGFRSGAGGLAKVDAPSGTLFSFATRPGSVASDGKGRNGLYTESLLKVMELVNIPIEQALKQVVRNVKRESNGKQEPWSEGSIEGDFYFSQTSN